MPSVLRNPAYRHLFAAQVIALVGTGLATVALGLPAYDIAGADAGSVLGTALGIKMMAYVAIAPAVGAIADRLPRRALMVGSDLVRASVALMLPFVDQVWQVYVLIFLLQSASAAFTPTFQAVIPDVLPWRAARSWTSAASGTPQPDPARLPPSPVRGRPSERRSSPAPSRTAPWPVRPPSAQSCSRARPSRRIARSRQSPCGSDAALTHHRSPSA